MKRRQKRVLIALGWYDYRLHRGIEKYAQELGWHLSANFAREKDIPWGWEGDGILAWLGAGDDLAEFVEMAKKPTVDFSLGIAQAKRLPASSREKIEALAELCGYQNANSLCVAFKNSTGMSPKQFRETARPGSSSGKRAARK